MPLIIAKHAGFCMGVRHAVEKAQETANTCLTSGDYCFSLGELINNPGVVDKLRLQGLHPVSSPEEAQGQVLVIRSHGVSQAVMQKAQELSKQVVDCTCPFVSKLHRSVAEHSRDGAPVILIGDQNHPEIVGTAGWCKGEVYILSTKEEVESLPDALDNALVVSQTTFPPDRFDALVLLLKQRYPGITVRNTICPATRERQKEAAEIAKQADIMVVIGGKNSANTRKLYETCKQHCENTYLVERAAELPSHIMQPDRVLIGITAGASTPDWSLKEVVDSMNDIERKELEQPEVAQENETVEKVSDPHEAPVETEQETVTEQPQEEEAQPVSQEQPEAQEEHVSDPHEEPVAEESAAQPEPEKSFMDQVADSIASIRPGQNIEGKVVQITEDEVCVNIGYKSDGLIKRSELVDKDVQLGDTIEVEIVKVNDGEGNVILSQRNIINKKLWEELMEKYDKGEFVEAVGKEAVKGGLLASINGVRAFVPASQLAQRYIDKISQFVGQPMKLKIIEVDSSKKRVVASRKAVLEEEGAKLKSEAWDRLKEGETVKGIVRRFAPFGAFVDLGGVDGLIHVSDLSWNRSVTPQDVLTINSEIDVVVLGLDQERERIQLGYKQLQPKPWDNVVDKYPVGTVLTRKVVRIRPFGAFIELEPGVDGLCHISQISVNRVNKVEDVLSPGQDVNVKVLSVDPEAKRISLSIREALEDNAFDYSEDIPGLDLPEESLYYTTETEAAPEEAAEEAVEEAAEEAVETVEEAAEEVSEAAEETVEAVEEAVEDEEDKA